jgi:C4-dicarboxylate-specific signal transduction histidine kinase
MMFSDQRFAGKTFDESEARQAMALRRWRAVVQCLGGSIALALQTAVCFRLRINLATTVCLYLIVVVLLPLQGSDTGVGLPAQQADQIFNAFFTTKVHGTGMGLRISRSIVESHGGRLWAADNSPRGASFCFSLPTKAEARE